MKREMRLAMVVYAALCLEGLSYGAETELERTLDAIARVESGGNPNAIGDRGAALGAYQIHEGYWKDGSRFLGVVWPYTDVKDPVKSRRIARAYLMHYAPSGSPEVWARIHNGGPLGYKRQSTSGYWKKISLVLTKTD